MKFGQLFLHRGEWNGEQILPEAWIIKSAVPEFYFPQTGRRGHRGYSYGWWPFTEQYGRGAYAARGWGGKEIIVMPEHDMVVVFTGGSYWSSPLLTTYQMMIQYVLRSID